MKALLFASLLLLAPTKTTVAELLKDVKLDGKEVSVAGKVDKFEQKTSRAGNAYFVFKLKDKDQEISGYGRGTLEPPLKNGDKAEITGVFKREKKLGDMIFKNEVEVAKKDGKFLVKLIK